MISKACIRLALVFALAGLGIFSSSGVLLAQATYLQCNAGPKTSRNALVPDQVIVAEDTRTGVLTVADSDGISTGQLPSKGRRLADTASRFGVQWDRKQGADRGRLKQPPITLALQLNRKTNRAQLTASFRSTSRTQKRSAQCGPLPAAQVAQIEKLLRNPKLRRELAKSRADHSRFTCKLNAKNSGLAFVPSEFEFDLPKWGDQAEMWDAFSLNHLGSKTQAHMDQENWPRVKVSWSVSNLSARHYKSNSSFGMPGTVRFEATLNRKEAPFRLRVRVKPGAAPLSFRGSCKQS